MKSKRKKAAPKPKPDQKYIQQLGDRITQLRKDKGYTSYEYFAYEHNISRAQFGRYEKGQDMRYSSLRRVVKAFGITMKEFFSEGFDD
jgi:transcriptional regulator with XRE-family HTH domain